MKMYTYLPDEIICIFGGQILSGYADGTFIKVSRDNPMWTMKPGADGVVTRVRTNDKTGTIEVTLTQGSASNDYLSGLAKADELTGAGALPVLCRDGAGSTVASALFAWLEKPADAEFSKDAGQRAWTIKTNELDLFVGGLAQ